MADETIVIEDETIEIEDDETTDVSEESQEDEETVSEEDNSLSKPKSNKSNWKKMNQELKKLRKENQALKASQDEDEDDYEDEDEADTDSSDLRTEIEQIKFYQSNPDAAKYSDGITEFLGKYPDGDLEDALLYAKAKSPESKTSKKFSTKSNTVTKKLSELTEAEAVKIGQDEPSKLLEWENLQLKKQGKQAI